MIRRSISDWDDAYSNSNNIAFGDRWPGAWVEPAKAFRESSSAAGRAQLDLSYGDKPRNRFDLFMPEGVSKGLVVFVHGGYWMALDKNYCSHFAKGCVDSGYTVAMPSYSLCPEVRIHDIVHEVGSAVVAAAGLVEGPIMLTGHSAGGHLVSRMVVAASPLPPEVQARIRHVVSLSGLHDLRPLINTEMNKTLHIDEAEALIESPALLRPLTNLRITCWVGGGERAEFLRQNELLTNIWTGLGAQTALIVEPDRHHYNVVDGFYFRDHPLTRTLLS